MAGLPTIEIEAHDRRLQERSVYLMRVDEVGREVIGTLAKQKFGD
jgi:hypothetical protein